MNFFIYRPDKVLNRRIKPEGLYTLKGQNFLDWERDKEEEYLYRVEKIKDKLEQKKSPR